MKQKTIVLSVDALVGEDLAQLEGMPNFRRLFKNAARVNAVRTIYPSITYPAHVSIMTGARPGKHGIYTNDAMQLTDGPILWHLDSSEILAEDIYAVAKRAGATTASCYWPVTGGNPNVDWLLNEYNFYDPNEGIEEAFARMGANEEMLRIVRKNLHLFPHDRANARGRLRLEDEFDGFLMACACDLIREHQPDLLLIHNCIVDSIRHACGLFGDFLTTALVHVDCWLGDLIVAMEDSGTLENTNFILLSDHGHMNYTRRNHINVLLRQNGFITVDENNRITDWKAFAQANGMSATVVLKDPNDDQTREALGRFLRERADEGVWGFSQVYTESEVREKYGTYGNFAFMLETDGFTAFGENWSGPFSVVNRSDYRLGKSNHGYEPHKGPQPVFLAVGPAFKPGAILDHADIIDEGPTIAAIFGQKLLDAEGRCLRELLRDGYSAENSFTNNKLDAAPELGGWKN